MSISAGGGVVAAGNPDAARAGAAILSSGGNAADAAVATALALCVTDPANISFFGRCHVLLREAGGQVHAVDGASMIPGLARPSPAGRGVRSGYQAAAVPGLPQALESFHARFGRLALPDVTAPAMQMAMEGVPVSPVLHRIWESCAPELAMNPHAKTYYGRVREQIRHPALAQLLGDYGRGGAEAVLTTELANRVKQGGGDWEPSDWVRAVSRSGEVVCGRFRGWRVFTIGRQGWGHTLVQMMAMLDRMPAFGAKINAAEARRLILVILTALWDRPQHLGTLRPKQNGVEFDHLISPDFISKAVPEILSLIDDPAGMAAYCINRLKPDICQIDQDTTHLSVIDQSGMAVSLTASIGPHFGARVADPLHGIMLANSYRMAHDPEPLARDVTEMTPAIVTGPNGEVLAIGAAGSERIPGAAAQVILNLIDRDLSLEAAVAAPRVNFKGGRLRIHRHMPQEVLSSVSRPNIPFEQNTDEPTSHLGIVQAVMRDMDGNITGAADPAYDGAVAAQTDQ